MNLADSLARTAAAHPDRVAIRLGEDTLSHRDLDDASARVAGLLAAHNVGPGDPVGLMLPNVPQFAVVYFGVLRAGGVVVPMNPLLKAREVAYYLGDCGASMIFAWQGARRRGRGRRARRLRPRRSWSTRPRSATCWRPRRRRRRSSTGPATTLQSSSTPRARPGGQRAPSSTHANLIKNAEVTGRDLLHIGEDDVIFGGLPLFHSFGQTCTLNTAVAAGASLTVLPRFDPAQALRMLADHHATVFAGVPTMYSALLHVPDRTTSTLRVCVSGGAAAGRGAAPVRGRVRVHRLEGYGLSETSPGPRSTIPTGRATGLASAPPSAALRCALLDDRRRCRTARSARSRSAGTTS